MLLFDSDLPDELRFCTWCQQGLEPTSAKFHRCKHGRHGLMTVCKTCQAHDARVRYKHRWENEEPEACACGAPGPLEVDHDHTDYPYAFRAYVYRSCNLKAREPWVCGPSTCVRRVSA